MIKLCYDEITVDYRYLQAFLHTARRLSFTQAAKDLGVTQAAVSRQVRLLEESLDLQLLIRSPQEVLLTSEGKRLFAEGSKFDAWIHEDLQGGIPTIRIAVLQGIIENWMLKIIDRHFKSANVNFNIRTGSPDAIDRAVEFGEVDLGINIHSIQSEKLTSFKLFKERIVVLSKSPINVAKLHEYPWVTFDPNTYLIPFCRKKSKRIIQVESNNAAVALVASGAGITMLPLHLIPDPDSFKIYPAEKFNTEFVWATTLNYSRPPEFLRTFIQLLRREAGNV